MRLLPFLFLPQAGQLTASRTFVEAGLAVLAADMLHHRVLAVLLLPVCAIACSDGANGTASPQKDGDTPIDAAADTANDSPSSSCPAGKAKCSGSCVDLNNDSAHCGRCGFACSTGQTCCEGSCSTQCSLSVTSVSVDHGPLSGGTWVTVQGSGFAAGARVWFGSSLAPTMVVDAATIRAQTSPHLEAKVDVRVQQGVDTAVRSEVFAYASYGFEGPWKKINMSAPRGAYPGVSVLLDGRALITGGRTASNNSSLLTSADIYDPITNATIPIQGSMAAPRVFVGQLTLLTGKALIVGTQNIYSAVPNAEIFDPVNTTFKPTTGQPPAPLNMAYMTLAPDGRVVVTSQSAAGVMLYDPATDAFSSVAGAPNGPNYEPVRLLDGRVLLVPGGPSAPSYIFDLATSEFSAAGNGPVANASTSFHRGAQRSVVVPDGRVLAIGGYGAITISVFDPNAPSEGFSTAPYELTETLHYTSVTLMGDGTVLTLGGAKKATNDCNKGGWLLTDSVERIDPVASAITLFDKLPDSAMSLGAVTLLDGSVIAGGGEVCGGAPTHPYLYYLEGRPPGIY